MADNAGRRRTKSRPAVSDRIPSDPPSAVSSDPRFSAALARAERAPSDAAAWDALEEINAELQHPEEVSALFLAVLKGPRGAELADTLGKRAVRFHEEWFGDQQAPLVELLQTLLALDPSLDWAFERLTLLLSAGQHWAELLDLYDQRLLRLKDGPERRKLLQEAAGVAKDFLGQMDRAIGYLHELFQAKPGDPHVAASLERLLEREARWSDLAKVWQRRLDYISGAEANELRGRLAVLRLDRLGDPEGAVSDARTLLSDTGETAVACQVLESVVASAKAPATLRRTAVELLREQYEKQGRTDRIVAILQTAHTFASEEEKVGLLRESAARLQEKGEGVAAMEKLVELLGISPDDTEMRTRLRHLAELSGRHDLYVQGLSAAAQSTKNGKLRASLYIEAGRVEEDIQGNHDAAILFFQRVAADEALDPGRRLLALRRLISLLDRDDQTEARLAALEDVAQLTGERAEKRTVLGQAGRLAARMGEIERATKAWQARLELDGTDREAMAALVELFTAAGQPALLCAILRQRAAVAQSQTDRRADLVQLARTQAQALSDRNAAIHTWLEIEREFGADNETTAALRELYGAEARWSDLADLLARSGETDRARLAALYSRLGDVHRLHLDTPVQAVAAYGHALEIDPAQSEARAGLRALIDHPGCELAALDALVRVCVRTREVSLLIELTERRLRLCDGDGARARLLVEAAELVERERADPTGAVRYLGRALAFAPEDALIERELLRLAPFAEHGFQIAVQAIRAAIEKLPPGASRVVDLRLREAALLETQLGDLPAALVAYGAAAQGAPDRVVAKAGRVRVAAALGRWSEAAEAMLAPPIAAEVVTTDLLPIIERAAEASGSDAFAQAAEAISAEIARRKGVPRGLARDLEATIATWWESRIQPASVERAVAALQRACRFDPHHPGTLQRLCALQRHTPDRALFDSLMRLSELQPGDLDPVHEALQLAHTTLDDRALALKTGLALFESAAYCLRAELPVIGKTNPATATRIALDIVVERLLASGDKSDAARAVAILQSASGLALPADMVRALRRRAAHIALEHVGDRARARELYRAVLEDEPTDRAVLGILARLYEEADLLSDALAARKRELGLVVSVEDRLAVRLEMARIAGLIEERGPRIGTLLANLEDVPGERATLEVLTRILTVQGKERDLVDILSEQAALLEQKGQTTRAAELWSEVATLCERRLADPARALAAYERVANLQPTPAGLDALARLCAARGDHLAAAGWLEQRLLTATGAERTAIALRLGRAYLECGQRHRAIGCLERALAEDSGATELRALLIDIYRKAESWEALARVLADGCVEGTPPEVVAKHAKESALLYQERLGRPELAVPVLERAVKLVPRDRWLRGQLAEGLRVAGRYGEAREMLASLLEEIGRRRSKERAAIHHQLALVARAEGDYAVALEHLDQAAAIDVSSMAVLIDLGATAEQAGQLERAERAYQALLVLARRGDPDTLPSSVSETLLCLERTARARGDAGAAAELYESAVAAALQNPSEARRMQAALFARGDGARALALLDKRRASAGSAGAEAQVLCERAELLRQMQRPEEALQTIATAIEKAPEDTRAHELGRAIAKELGDPARYLAIVEAALAEMRRRDDGPRVCDLLLRAGAAAETDVGDLARAASFYARAEETGARTLDVLVAIGRVSARRADLGERARVEKQLARMAESAASPDEAAEITYRLAELLLGSETTRAQGLETLARALDQRPDFARALGIVRAAEVPQAELPRVMPLYERVARSSGDDRMLLDFLERRASTDDVNQEIISEGVEVALALGEGARAEVLLERAVKLAKQQGNVRAAAWALLDLAQRRKSAGDLAAAFSWLEAAREVSDNPRIPALLRELGREAARQAGGAELAARAFERLRERNPADRELWLPLMETYVAIGDGVRLRALVESTVTKLIDRADRILVRMTWARFLLRDPACNEEAAGVLRDVLLEEPGHPEALASLADLHESRGEIGEALALLSEVLREAEAQGDEARRSVILRRLGDLLGKADPEQAKTVYRQTLASTIGDPGLRRELQERLYELLGPEEAEEKAGLAESMLADETGMTAAARALALADLRRALGDDEGERRALELGLGRAPHHPVLFERLSSFFSERADWDGWAELMVGEAERLAVQAPRQAAELYRRIARVRREQLGDAARAVVLLRRARELVPDDVEQLRALIACYEELGDLSAAVEVVSDAIGRVGLGAEERLSLLRMRAELHARCGQAWSAVEDLERAFAEVGLKVASELADVLQAAVQSSAREDDLAGQRRATLRLAELHGLRGHDDEAQRILFTWIEEHPEDVGELQGLRARFEAAGRFEDVARVCQRMLRDVSAEGRVSAALGLANALAHLGRAQEAVSSLEEILAEQPGQPAIVNLLSALYQESGDVLKIAHLKIQQAALMQSEDDQFQALVEGADMLLQGGEARLAVDAINRAFALRPEDRVVQRLLGDALLANGQFDQAATVLEQLIGDGRGLDGEELCALYHRLSRAAGGMSDAGEQLNCLRKAMEADRKNGHVAAELADLAEALGDDELALKALRAITLNAPDGPMSKAVAFYRQARIAHKHGDRQRALIFAKRALQEDASLVEAQQLLAEVR